MDIAGSVRKTILLRDLVSINTHTHKKHRLIMFQRLRDDHIGIVHANFELQYFCNMSQSLQKPPLLDSILSHQNMTLEFGVWVLDKRAAIMSQKNEVFFVHLTRNCIAFVFFKCFSKCVMAAPQTPAIASSSSARKARRESVVPIGITVECDTSFLVHDDTLYGDKYDAGAAAAEWSDSDTEENSSSTSVLRHGSDLTSHIATSQSRDEEVSDVDETMDIEQLDNSFLSLPDQYSNKIASALAASGVRNWKKKMDVDARSQIATLTSTSISSSASHLRQENSKNKNPFAVRDWTSISVDADNYQHCQKAGIFLLSPHHGRPYL